MLLKENYSRSLWESQETNTLRGQDSRKRFMRLALCKRPTWPQYRIKYSRCSQLRPGFIVSSKVLNQFVQVCTKHVRVLCRNIKRSHSYTTATSVYMYYKVKPSLCTPGRHTEGVEVHLYSFLTLEIDEHAWWPSRRIRFIPRGKAPPISIRKKAG